MSLSISAQKAAPALLWLFVLALAISGCTKDPADPVPFVAGSPNGAELDSGHVDDIVDRDTTFPDDVDTEGGDIRDGDADANQPDANGSPCGDDPQCHLGVQCVGAVNNWVSFDFEIQASTTSYMVVSYSDGGWINPSSITGPDQMVVDFQGANDFQTYGLEYPETQWINAVVIPPAPQFSHQLQSGTHTFLIASEEPELCYYVIESSGPATTIDFNFYFLGLDDLDLTSSTADTHGDFQSILSSLDDIFVPAGISIGEVRYMDLSSQVVDMYRIIHSEWDVYDLIAHSQSPGADLDSALSLNVFVTEQFTDGSIGLSMGIPGPAGFHESMMSGIALSGEYIGIDAEHNLFTAVLIAHEVGHFLGLFHTSELDNQSHDHLGDTPECNNINQSWNCPDAHNLMFPYIDFDTTEITPDQAFVLRANPLTK